jgi:hypothetical protein
MLLGCYALQGGSFLANVPLPKSSSDIVKMIVYFDIINLMGITWWLMN